MYHFLRLLSFVLVRPFYRIKYIGRENVPKGAFVLASNHISYFDPVCLGMGFRRKIWFMAKSELFTDHGAFAGAFLRLCGVFPVARSSADKCAVDKASEHLHRGRIVGVFPQGGIRRDGQAFEPKAGAAKKKKKNSPALAKDDTLKSARELNRRFKAQINKMSEEEQ